MNAFGKKIILIISGSLLTALLLFGGLVFFQLYSFDKFTIKDQREKFGLLVFDFSEFEKSTFKRRGEVKIYPDFETPDENNTLILQGEFSPGFFPAINFSVDKNLTDDLAVIKKANPKISLRFDPLLNPRTLEINWNEAQHDGEKIGRSKILADFKLDKKSHEVLSLILKANIGAYESSILDAKSYFPEQFYSYEYHDNPRKLYTKFALDANKISGVDDFVSLGPLNYNFAIEPYKGNKNKASFELNVKELQFKSFGLPKLNYLLKGNITTSENVWLPCLTQLIYGSDYSFLPGVCPKGCLKDPVSILKNEEILGNIDKLVFSLSGVNIELKGDFSNKNTFTANFDISIKFEDKPLGENEKDLILELKRFVQKLLKDKACILVNEREFRIPLSISLNQEGEIEVLGNGVDLLNSTELLGDEKIEKDGFYVSLSLPPASGKNKDELKKVTVNLDEFLTNIEEVERFKSIYDKDLDLYIYEIKVKGESNLPKVDKDLNAYLKKLKDEMHLGYELQTELNYYGPQIIVVE